jgi:serine/threonine-protein kinase
MMGRKILIFLAVGAGTTVGVALLFHLFMTVLVGGRQITVPDVRGMREDAAARALGDHDLKYQIIGEEFSVDYPESTVSGQNPQPGQIVKQGRKIVVMMSKGGEFKDVPYCVGKPLRTARIILGKGGLLVGSVARVSLPGGYPEEVLSTEPLPGASVVRGSPVNILVNEGTKGPNLIIPDLRRQSYLGAKMKLERLGFFVQESSLDERFNPLRSRIVLHDPPVGHVVSRGDTVTLIISVPGEDKGESM